MKSIVPEENPDYRLLDSGLGRKLESFSGFTVDRPEPQADWPCSLPRSAWDGADSVCRKAGQWMSRKDPPEPWIFRWKGLKLGLKLAPYKHTGVFPEQMANWEWLEENVRLMGAEPRVLNLFAYTGGATLACARAGARVCHVDSSKPAVAWARENQALSRLSDRPIRWIIDDCLKFSAREARRGARYHGIIMDPPAFGRGLGGKVFKFGRDVPKLLETCRELLSEGPGFLLVNSYNAGISTMGLRDLISPFAPGDGIECGRLGLRQESDGRVLECGVFARFSSVDR